MTLASFSSHPLSHIVPNDPSLHNIGTPDLPVPLMKTTLPSTHAIEVHAIV